MFNKKNIMNETNDFDIVIGENSIFDGKISSEGSIRIDGKLEGDIEARGNIVIGGSALINGNIITNDIKISGLVNGNILAKGLLKIYETGNLNGDLECSSFIIEEGGTFEGRCNIKGNKSSLDDNNAFENYDNLDLNTKTDNDESLISEKENKADKKNKKKSHYNK
ncbi:bactofilin family protein [Helicovermis profundi]|uniref:Polymer-forming cytoskeletal protein n=1 Tax=Helicovermis profundi TaxID=3065157 RepID=A0AAU9E4M3_9FIRM|nr:hypothetical protein HLPR_12810 [Clostridia bacterium S502]